MQNGLAAAASWMWRLRPRCKRLVITAPVSRAYSGNVQGARLEYRQHGIPSEVVELREELISWADLRPGQIFVKMLASPVNPADINTIQGTYPIKPPLPAVGGGEGVGEVVEARGCRNLKPGDWILPSVPMSGTWRTHAIFQEEAVIPIRNDISIEAAATVMINPATALRMIKDFVPLKEGDWLVQNGANSAVGLAVIQLAKEMKLKTINVVRNRENIAGLKSELSQLGATVVLTEEEARQALRELPRPRLALNCVGGASATELCKALADGGVHVTYGGMSLKPVIVATSHLIFKDIEVRGFWMSRWNQQQGQSPERVAMYNYLADMLAAGMLRPPPLTHTPLADYKLALEATLKGFKPAKYLFVM